METMELDEYLGLLKQQGVSKIHLAFRCPMCATVQSAHDLIQAGAGADFDAVEKYLGFSCIGRWTHGQPPPDAKKKGTQVGCNWTLGGLFRICNLVVVTPEGEKHYSFDVCSPDEAEEHMKMNLETTEVAA